MIARIGTTLAALLLLFVPAMADGGLAGSAWRFVAVAGEPVAEGVTADIAFGADGTAAGSSGCNRYSGAYDATEDAIRFGDIMATKMFCVGPAMDVERAVFGALEATAGYSVGNGMLQLRDADGATVAELTTDE